MPKLKARFELDSDGRPQFVQGRGAKHYRIVLLVVDVPEAVASVTYRLDKSYLDPLREVLRAKPGSDFEERLTSYGDYMVEVSLSGPRRKGGPALRAWLSDALRAGHPTDAPGEDQQAVLGAIKEIEEL
jgi:hypothetical protein